MAASSAAFAVQFDRTGDPCEVLHYAPCDLPEPGRGELRVRMLAAPINPSDLLYIRGDYTLIPRLPAIPGFEGVGIVEHSGGGLLGRLLCGRRVAVLGSRTGTWATHAIAAARQVVPVDSRLSDDQAAMFFINPATAWILTSAVLGLRRGDTLVQTAAASMVGRMVIRLGQRLGFQTVNVVRRESQAASLRSMGAEEIIVSDGNGLSEALTRRFPQGIRHAMDPVGGLVASELIRCLGPAGQLVLYGTLSGEDLSLSARSLMSPGALIRGFWLGEFMQRQSLLQKLRIVRSVSRLVQEGTLASLAGPHFRLDEVATAVAEAERPDRAGKTILTCPR